MKVGNGNASINAKIWVWPYTVLVLYFVFEITRLQTSLFPFLSPLKLPAILTVSLIYYSVFVANKDVFKLKTTKLYLFFVFSIVLSSIFSANFSVAFRPVINCLVWLAVFFIPTINLLTTKKRISIFFFIFVACNTFIAIWGLTHGGRGPGSFTRDENDLALYMSMAIPFSFYLSFQSNISIKLKLFYRISTAIIIMSIVASFSRGGFLGLISVVGIIWYIGQAKVKTVVLVILLSVPVGVIIVKSLPDGYIEDMQSISDESNNTRNERLHSWNLALNMFYDSPIVGIGASNYPRVVGEYELKVGIPDGRRPLIWRAAHSLYFTLIPELGLLGVIAYFLFLRSIFNNVKVVYSDKRFHDNDLIVLLAKAIFTSIIPFLVSGAFISVLFYPNIFIIAAFSIVIKRWYDASLESKDEIS